MFTTLEITLTVTNLNFKSSWTCQFECCVTMTKSDVCFAYSPLRSEKIKYRNKLIDIYKTKKLIMLLTLISTSSSSSFPLLCGVDVSCETPPSRPVLRVLLRQPPLRQIVPDVIHPPPLWSSSPSFPRHLHPQYSLPYVFVFSKHAHTTLTYSPALSWIFLPLLSSL